MDRSYRERLTLSFLLSMLFYVILLHFIGNFRVNTPNQKTNTSKPIEVSIIKKPSTQIVGVPPVPAKKNINKNKTYLSNKTQIVPHNVVSKNYGPPMNRRKRKKQNKLNPTEETGKITLSKINSLLPSPSNQVSTQDNVIKEKVGPFTLISTVTSDVAEFVLTEGRRVLRVLEENIQNYTWLFSDIYSFKKEAVVKVVFSPEGKIEKIDLIKSSGSPKLDRVFFYSVKGGLIENVPPGKKRFKLKFILGKNYLKITAGE